MDKYFFEEIKKYSNITFNGFTEPDDVHLILSSYDVLVLPTRYKGEGFPGAIIDAYIAGLPVVVSKWRDIPSFVDEGVTGYIYNLENEKEFYDYLIKMGENKNQKQRNLQDYIRSVKKLGFFESGAGSFIWQRRIHASNFKQPA